MSVACQQLRFEQEITWARRVVRPAAPGRALRESGRWKPAAIRGSSAMLSMSPDPWEAITASAFVLVRQDTASGCESASDG